MSYKLTATKPVACLTFAVGLLIGANEAIIRPDQSANAAPPPTPAQAAATKGDPLNAPAPRETSYSPTFPMVREWRHNTERTTKMAFETLPKEPKIQDNPARVTYSCAAVPVPAFLERVGKQAGLSIVARGEAAKRPVSLQLKDESVTMTLAKVLAQVDGVLLADDSRPGGFELWDGAIAPMPRHVPLPPNASRATVRLQWHPSSELPVLPDDPRIKDCPKRVGYVGSGITVPTLLSSINKLASLNIVAKGKAAEARVEASISNATVSFALVGLLQGIDGVLLPVKDSPGCYELWFRSDAPLTNSKGPEQKA